MSDQVLNLFRQRLEQRLGQRTELDPEIAAFGQGLGLGPPVRQRGEGGNQAPQVATLANQAPGGAPRARHAGPDAETADTHAERPGAVSARSGPLAGAAT